MSDIAIVQLGRYGDIVNALPMALRWHERGLSVDWIVHEKFADILEAVSYVVPRTFSGDDSDVESAAKFAERFNPKRIIKAQVNGNHTGRQVEGFCLQNWLNAGMLQWYHAPGTRLLFDRRDLFGEQSALCESIEFNAKPIMGYCVWGMSSEFDNGWRFEAWLKERYSKEFRLLPIGNRKLRKAHHLIGLVDACDVLISIDSLPLHLSFATRTPTIAISREILWYQSEQRTHWIGRVLYPELDSKAGLAKVERMVETREGIRHSLRSIIHVVDWFDSPDRGEKRRMNRARHSWGNVGNEDPMWQTVIHELHNTQRNSSDLGDSRRLPYLKDVIDRGYSKAGQDDYVVLTNADSCLPIETPHAIRAALAQAPCAYSPRIDVNEWKTYGWVDLAGKPTYAGTDLFAFRASWWTENRDRMPDMLLACEGWDFVLRKLMQTSGGIQIEPPVVYHERHDAFWSRHRENPGQKYNCELGRKWALENGYESDLHPGPYLFK